MPSPENESFVTLTMPITYVRVPQSNRRTANVQRLQTVAAPYHSRKRATTNVDPVTTTTSSYAATRRATVSASTGIRNRAAVDAERCRKRGQLSRRRRVTPLRFKRRKRKARRQLRERFHDRARIFRRADRDDEMKAAAGEALRKRSGKRLRFLGVVRDI